jgi:succinate dehydrogenase / fumarate reductase membrane anchor subunit
MALRARKFEEAKRLSTSNLELAWWVFMRVSGVLLVFLVLGHLYWRAVLFNFHHDLTYDVVAQNLSSVTWKFYNWLLLFLSMMHGTNGLRYIMDDYIRNPRARIWTKLIVYTLVFMITVFGTIALWGWNYAPAA